MQATRRHDQSDSRLEVPIELVYLASLDGSRSIAACLTDVLCHDLLEVLEVRDVNIVNRLGCGILNY